METVLRVPRRALVMKIKAVSAPGMAEDVMDRTKPVKCATELTVQERMKARAGGGGRGDLESPLGAYREDELAVAFVGLGTTGEDHSYRPPALATGKQSEQVIRFPLQLPVRLNDLGIAMSASRLQIPLAHQGGRRRRHAHGCLMPDVVPHLQSSVPTARSVLTTPAQGRLPHAGGRVQRRWGPKLVIPVSVPFRLPPAVLAQRAWPGPGNSAGAPGGDLWLPGVAPRGGVPCPAAPPPRGRRPFSPCSAC